MSSENIAIRVHGVSKVYPIYDRPHHRLLQMLSRHDKGRWFREFWAVRDVDFSVARGETLGIVGRNGSGKSTLLQMICGTLTPSAGSIDVRGRVAALLELGSGFNPDFTGRENVFLNGTVLGLTRPEIEDRFDDIAAFADIGEFIDQPVKSYSSGMYVRLAFAVAINVMPDILVVDEALSVGDEAFQRKCFARINAIRENGATILFVSHSASVVTELCNRAVLLDHGELLGIGAPKTIVSRYQKMLYAPADRLDAIRSEIRAECGTPEAAAEQGLALAEAQQVVSSASGVEMEEQDELFFDEGLVPQSTLHYESLGAEITDVRLETPGGKRVNVLKADREYVYAYNVVFRQSASAVRFGMMIKTVTGLELGGGASSTLTDSIVVVEGGQEFEVRFRFRAHLAPGTYFLNAGVVGRVGEEEGYLGRCIDVAMFRVMHDPERLATGLINFDIQPSFRSAEA
ncbi:ABC transporter ATP-binding protein [Dyella sp. EPa41]|uniref:ABC transporter ATP-binding protein n=1 Tax=Dyella sp. EPa41 TaxID=1561194 RepID=UPI001915F9CC|nr:ABC transporter ATP-binding protein [Dyella sp. EPa41]